MVKAKLLKQTFEIRYEGGYRYLDRCGEAMLIFEKLLPDVTGKVWMPVDIVPAGAKLKSPELDVVLVFDTTRLIVEQTYGDVELDFPSLCETAYSVLSSRFDLKTVIRSGCRRFFVVPTDSLEDAEKLSLTYAPWKTWPGLEGHGLRPRSAEATAIFETGDETEGCRVAASLYFKSGAPEAIDDRVRLPSRLLPQGQKEALLAQLRMQKQREKDPSAGLMLDVDYYWTRPPKLDLKAFFGKAMSESTRLVDAYLERRNTHEGGK